MIGHTFVKLYGIVLEMKLLEGLEHLKIRAVGHTGFKSDYRTVDHSFTLWVVIEEARKRSSKVFYCFVDFTTAFEYDMIFLL